MTSRAGRPVTSWCADLREAEAATRQPRGEEPPQGRTDRPGNPTPEVVRLGLIVADDLDHRGYRGAGIVRHLAQLVATGSDPEGPETCPVCRSEVEQAPVGRRAVYCSPRCRKAAWRERNETNRRR